MVRATSHPSSGHPVKTNTYERLHQSYYWGDMEGFVCRYVRNCHTCKSSRFAKQGVLEPLPIPEQRWRDIKVDFVTGVAEVDGKDAHNHKAMSWKGTPLRTTERQISDTGNVLDTASIYGIDVSGLGKG